MRTCPNCNSNRFIETVSREFCPSCDLECNYHGSGANDVYLKMMDRHYLEQKIEKEEQDRIWHEQNAW